MAKETNMKTTFKFIILAALVAVVAFPQTTVPSTTLCAAVTSSQQTSVCLASTTNIVNQTGLYIDNEYMVVNMANGQTLGATNAQVPVTRNNRAGNGPPSLHNSGQTAWIALAAGSSINPGENGFSFGTQLGDVGPCVRTSITYLPHFWPNRGVVRDCNAALGYWVDAVSGPIGQYTSAPLGEPYALANASTVTISAHASAIYVITYTGGAETITLGVPTATVDDFKTITFLSATAHAHVIAATAGTFYFGVATYNTQVTLPAYAGASVTFLAYQGHWILVSSNGTLTPA
jgi:hypothetical protein